MDKDFAKDMRQSQLHTRNGASNYLQRTWGMKLAPQTLAKFATLGGGPKFHKAGRTPLYPENELDSFAREKLGPLRASTSEVTAPSADEQTGLSKLRNKRETDDANNGGTQC